MFLVQFQYLPEFSSLISLQLNLMSYSPHSEFMFLYHFVPIFHKLHAVPLRAIKAILCHYIPFIESVTVHYIALKIIYAQSHI